MASDGNVLPVRHSEKLTHPVKILGNIATKLLIQHLTFGKMD
jgi:hypothetical protein